MKARIAALAVLLAASPSVFGATDSPSREIRFAIIYHQNNNATHAYVEAANRFKRDVEAKTGGRLTVRLIDVATFGTAKADAAIQTLSRVADGRIEMCDVQASAVSIRYDRRFRVFDMPYVFRSYEHAERVVSGPVGRMIAEKLPEKNLTALAYTYSGGFRAMASKSPLTARSLRGQRVHVELNRLLEDQFSAWGAVPVLARREASADLLRAGKVDAVEVTYNGYEGWGLSKWAPVLNVTDHNFFVTVMLANKDFLQSLPAPDRDVVVAAAEEAAAHERRATIRENADVRERARKAGATVVDLSEADKRELARASAEVRRKWARRAGQDIVDAVEAAAESSTASAPRE